MTHAHTVVWIDHREAHIVGFGIAGIDRKIIHNSFIIRRTASEPGERSRTGNF